MTFIAVDNQRVVVKPHGYYGLKNFLTHTLKGPEGHTVNYVSRISYAEHLNDPRFYYFGERGGGSKGGELEFSFD